jgi:hypothetical protein
VRPLVDPKEKGRLVWDAGFAFDSKTQQFIYDSCADLRLQSFVKPDEVGRLLIASIDSLGQWVPIATADPDLYKY